MPFLVPAEDLIACLGSQGSAIIYDTVSDANCARASFNLAKAQAQETPQISAPWSVQPLGSNLLQDFQESPLSVCLSLSLSPSVVHFGSRS